MTEYVRPLVRDEFVEDHLLRHLPVYINGPLWRCICTAKGDSAPGFGADGWRKHIGLSIGHLAALDVRAIEECPHCGAPLTVGGYCDNCRVMVRPVPAEPPADFGEQVFISNGLGERIVAEGLAKRAGDTRLRNAAQDLYSLAVGEHGHDETHAAIWPSCLPAHIAMNRYRDAIAGDES